MEHSQKHELQRHDDHRHQDVQHHAGADLAADPQVVVRGKDDGGHRGADGVDPEVLGCLPGKLTLGAHGLHKSRRQDIEQRTDNNSCAEDHKTGAGEDVVGLPVLLFPQADGDGDRGPHAHQVRQGEVDDDKGHGQVQGGEGRLPQKAAYKHAVDGLVEGGGQHAHRPGQGGQEKQPQRGRMQE